MKRKRCRCCGKDHENCNWKEIFKKSGMRFTIPRQEIISVLGQSDDYLSCEEIYNKISKKNPDIGIATIYRTIDVLTRMGVLLKMEFGDKVSRYEIAGKNHHHYLMCTNCNKIIDYTDDIDKKECEQMKNTEQFLSDKFDFKINQHVIRFYGICKECQKLNS